MISETTDQSSWNNEKPRRYGLKKRIKARAAATCLDTNEHDWNDEIKNSPFLQSSTKQYTYHDFSRSSSISPGVVEELRATQCSTNSPNCNDVNHILKNRLGPSVEEQKLPTKLHLMLINPCYSDDIICWMPHGRSWKVLNQKKFVKKVMPNYFAHNNYNSFIRLVNAWGFRRITTGIDQGSYFHELFLRNMPHLHKSMHRLTSHEKKIPVDPESVPDFYDIAKKFPLPDDSEAAVLSSQDQLLHSPAHSNLKIGDTFRPQNQDYPLSSLNPNLLLPQHQLSCYQPTYISGRCISAPSPLSLGGQRVSFSQDVSLHGARSMPITNRTSSIPAINQQALLAYALALHLKTTNGSIM